MSRARAGCRARIRHSGRASAQVIPSILRRFDRTPPSVEWARDQPRTLASQGVPALRCQHPKRRHQDALRLLLAHRPSAQPWRIAHSRTLRCRPTTCHTQLPAGLEMPPNAAIALCTRRRASSCRSLRSGSRPVPGTRRIGTARSGSSWAMMNAAWKSLAAVCIACSNGATRAASCPGYRPSGGGTRCVRPDPSLGPPRAHGRAPGGA